MLKQISEKVIFTHNVPMICIKIIILESVFSVLTKMRSIQSVGNFFMILSSCLPDYKFYFINADSPEVFQ